MEKREVLETESGSLSYHLHLTGLDQLLDLFKTWISHLLNGDNGANPLS